MSNPKESILVIGAGLCGSLLALRMAQRGYNVQVMEMRPDLRKVDISAGRSINLAFSNRGLKAIKMVGLEDQVLPLCIPMYGRMLHDRSGDTIMSKYSGRTHEYINSISRELLTGLLLNELETHKNVQIKFNQRCTHVDFEAKTADFECLDSKEKLTVASDLIFGTDGAGSVLRKSYILERKFLFNFSQDYLTHGYKELTIPPKKNGGFRTTKNVLHIWPRGDFMIIALPNLDGSFTVTLFLSYTDGEYNFNNLDTPKRVLAFFKKEFPDTLDLMPNLTEEFFRNPTAPLGTVKCFPWQYKGHTLLMGDAAHAIVPFYGQGMNASFEDVAVFDSFLDQHKGNWEQTFEAFQTYRKIDTDAIADLAIDNYHEMRDHVAQPVFQKKRKLELELESSFPEKYFSKYSLVTFNDNTRYHKAMLIGRAQDQVIQEMITDNELQEDQPIDDILAKVTKKTHKIINQN